MTWDDDLDAVVERDIKAMTVDEIIRESATEPDVEIVDEAVVEARVPMTRLPVGHPDWQISKQDHEELRARLTVAAMRIADGKILSSDERVQLARDIMQAVPRI